MKTYLELLKYVRPISQFLVPYTFFVLLYTVFSLVNLTLLIPIFEILFDKISPEQLNVYRSLPRFSLEPSYFIHLFYYNLLQVIAEYGKFGAIQFVSAVLVFSVFMSNLFNYMSIRTMEYMRAHAVQNIRFHLFDRVISLHLAFFNEQRKGDILTRFTSDVQELEHAISKSILMLVKDPIMIIIFFSSLFAISVNLTLFTLLLIPISGFFISFITQKLKRASEDAQNSLSQTTSIIEEALSGLRVIKAFGAKDYILGKYQEENKRYAGLIRKMARTRELASPVSEFMGVTSVAFILLYGGSLVLQENSGFTAAMFLTYIALFTQIINPAKSLTTSISNLQRGAVAGRRILDLMHTPNAIEAPKDAREMKAFSASIQFDNVSFRYEEDWVLKNVSFELKKGKTIALVGQSGGGKSTIANLIPRFFDVQEGAILIDGQNIKDYTLESLTAQMGIVTQEPILFHDSIFNNIAFSSPEASRETVEQAARIANAHDFIMQTASGYDTVIGDRGMKLSGGQRQRLSIARAVLKNPPILILDEATSALDTESEKLVQEALNHLMQNRTSLIIAHRLSTVQHADEILVIQNGKIQERGNHQSLMQNESGIYKKLNLLQNI